MIHRNWSELIKPAQLDVRPGADPQRSATVVAEPLERGFGLTLGNALRRVLLSSLQGAAITSVQIDNVLHEFSSVAGVREDVTVVDFDDLLAVLDETRRRLGDLPEWTFRWDQVGTDLELHPLAPDDAVLGAEPGVGLEPELLCVGPELALFGWGAHADLSRTVADLDAALLTDAEFAAGPDAWG